MTEIEGLSLTPLMDRLRPLLAAEETPVYVVGGAVRDAVLGRANHDIDLAVPSGAIALTFRLANALGYPAYAMDVKRDVGRILVLEEGTTLDIARFRGSTLEDDLLGRDFTINALAMPADGHSIEDIIDLHKGLDDLATKDIRVVHEHTIADDPVRALRAARFSVQLGFRLTAETRAAAQAIAPTLPERTSAERIRDELSQLLSVDEPHAGIALLHELGLLAPALPEIAALDGIAQSSPHHEGALQHTLTVLRYLAQIERLVDGRPVTATWSEEVEQLIKPYRTELCEHLDKSVDGGFKGRLLLRWGGLFHDAGKAATQTIDPDGRIRFTGHDEAGADIAGERLSSFGFSNEAVRRVRHIVGGHMRPLYLTQDGRLPSRRATYRYFKTLHEAGQDVGLLALADHLATYDGIGGEQDWKALLATIRVLFGTYFEDYEQTIAPPRLLDGQAVMELANIPPGHEVGRLLRLLEEAQAAGEVSTRDEAAVFIQRHAGR